LVEEWEILEDYAGDKQGFYQIIEDGAETVEIRVAIGRLGFKKEFQNKGDMLLNRILSFCKSRNYIKVSENVRDEFFFK
jgi:GNAT superfamily N-acetyltransferase